MNKEEISKLEIKIHNEIDGLCQKLLSEASGEEEPEDIWITIDSILITALVRRIYVYGVATDVESTMKMDEYFKIRAKHFKDALDAGLREIYSKYLAEKVSSNAQKIKPIFPKGFFRKFRK